MPPKAPCQRRLALQHLVLAPLDRGMRAQHQWRWQTPQQNERPSRHASSPMSATNESDYGNKARCSQNDISRPTQHDQIRIALVGCSESEDGSSEPEQDEADTLEDLHKNEGLVRGASDEAMPVSNLSC